MKELTMKKATCGKILLIIVVFVAVSGVKAEIGAGNYFKYACALYENEDFFYAAEQFIKITRDYPGTKEATEAEYLLGECLQREKRYWAAMDHYKGVIKNYPNTELSKKCAEALQMLKMLIESSLILAENERTPVTMNDMLSRAYAYNAEDSETRIYINGAVVEPEFQAGMFWTDKAITECKSSLLTAKAFDVRGFSCWLRTSPEDYKRCIDEMMKIFEMYPEEDQRVLRNIQWSADTAKNQLGDTAYARKLYKKLLEESKKRIGDVSYYGTYAKTQACIMGQPLE